jgi:hypothetical protein
VSCFGERGRRARRAAYASGMSMSESRSGVDMREAVAEALAPLRADGLEPSPEGLAKLEAIAEGRLTTDEAIEQLLARYRR